MAAIDDCDGKIMAKVCNNDNSEKFMLSYPVFTRNQHKIFLTPYQNSKAIYVIEKSI